MSQPRANIWHQLYMDERQGQATSQAFASPAWAGVDGWMDGWQEQAMRQPRAKKKWGDFQSPLHFCLCAVPIRTALSGYAVSVRTGTRKKPESNGAI